MKGKVSKGQMIESERIRSLGKGDSELAKKLDKEAERKAAQARKFDKGAEKEKVCQNG